MCQYVYMSLCGASADQRSGAVSLALL
jgi:hypothetical protein